MGLTAVTVAGDKVGCCNGDTLIGTAERLMERRKQIDIVEKHYMT